MRDLDDFLAEGGAIVGGGAALGRRSAAYAGFAGVVTVVGLAGLVWMEFAPDGAFRRRPQS